MIEEKVSPVLVPERQRLQLLYDRYRPQYDNLLRRVSRQINKRLDKTHLNFSVKYRLKSFDSYFEKIMRLRNENKKPVVMTDLIALRIICPFIEDLHTVEKIISKLYPVLEVEHKAEKKSFHEFSYDSIHLLIQIPIDTLSGTIPYATKVCEVQLRTILQEAWAEVEHELIYKANFSLLNEPIKRKLASLNASLTLSDIIFQEIRDYQKEIESRREKCRDILQEKVQRGDKASLIETVGQPAPVKTGGNGHITPLKPKSELERLLFEALEAHSKNELDTAIKTYTQILRIKLKPPVKSIIYNHRGMALFVKSEYEKAIKDFSRAIRNNPKNTRVYNNRGLAYRMIHQYSRALQDLDRSLEINNYQYEAFHLRALSELDLKNLTGALENCEKALEIKPDFAAALNLKAVIISKLGY
jgi:putative GTP pyrophosphokinase